MNIVYLRVSKEDEKLQDLDVQLDKIKEKFNISIDAIYKERGSAYDLKKINKRKEFLSMMNLLFDSYNETIHNVFLRNLKEKETINLYVWDYHRIMRNLRLNLLFLILCDLNKVNIHSYKQGSLNQRKDEIPSETFARYMMNSINAFSSEDYAWNSSQNIKKSVVREDDLTKHVTKSWKGNLWGNKFTNKDGIKITLKPEEAELMTKDIIRLIKKYENLHYYSYYDKIIKYIEEKYMIVISKSKISKIKKEFFK